MSWFGFGFSATPDMGNGVAEGSNASEAAANLSTHVGGSPNALSHILTPSGVHPTPVDVTHYPSELGGPSTTTSGTLDDNCNFVPNK